MLDFGHIQQGTGVCDVQQFYGYSKTAGEAWQTWIKPRGKTMCNIILIGKGGNGGNGVLGNNSTAAGGGGGGSGGMTSLTMPLLCLPDTLSISLAGQSATTTLASYISVYPATTANYTIAIANGGGNGGNGAGATAGSVGAAGAIATNATMPIGWQWANPALAGQAGIIGGTTVSAGTLTIPVTGLVVTGGTGGGGLPAAAAVGTVGGSFVVPTGGIFCAHTAGTSAATATTPGANGAGGVQPVPRLLYYYGGLGGGSSHGTATTTGLVGGNGGNAEYGCGGGGGGGCLTGGVAGVGGFGGQAIAIITCW